jgi:hypothetical protein
MVISTGFKKTWKQIRQFLIRKKNQTGKQQQSMLSHTKDTSSSSLHMPKGIFIAISCILVSGICVALLYLFGISAKIILTVNPKVIHDEQAIVFTPGNNNDFSKNKIAAKEVSVDEKGSVSTDATGIKEIGTYAKGTITIFSTLTSLANLSKGTVVISNNNLKYTLDDTVTIASSSGDAGDYTTVSNISVTATAIGSDYNIPSGTKFTVDSLSKSDVSGKNDNPFSGGTKKDITIVSQKDIDQLTNAIIKTLSDKAKQDIQKELDDSQQVLPLFIKQDVIKKSFSKNIGEEAKSINLDGTVTYKSLSINKNDIRSFASGVMKDKITDDMILSENGIQTDIANIKQDKDTISATVKLKALLLPKVNPQQTANDVAGKPVSQATEFLKSIPQVSQVTITISPNFPFLPKLLPRIARKIIIHIVTND